jgi:Flp pilus assembly protein TadD
MLELGRRALVAGRSAEAAGRFRAVLDEDPDQSQARFGLAAVAAQRGDWDAARSELTSLLAVDPRHAEGWNLLGVVEGRREDPAAAWAAFERALTADPFFPEALANAGLLALERGDREAARRLLGRLRDATGGAPTREERALADALARTADTVGTSATDLDPAQR